MRRALIGHTGFVGGNLTRQAEFDLLVRSTDVDRLRGGRFDLVVCAGAGAQKWKANQDPATDLAGIERLIRVLQEVRAERFVLVSTVDVYQRPVEVDEEAPPDATHPYGEHRRMLERFCADRFAAQIVRLPALFGPGLKKNALYDLLHDNQVDRIHPESRYQFYDVRRLWGDAQKAGLDDLRIAHLVTEPVSMREVAERCFGHRLAPSRSSAARYDVRTRHAELWGGRGGYLQTKESVLSQLEAFVRAERAR